jgi:hypothetical protein
MIVLQLGVVADRTQQYSQPQILCSLVCTHLLLQNTLPQKFTRHLLPLTCPSISDIKIISESLHPQIQSPYHHLEEHQRASALDPWRATADELGRPPFPLVWRLRCSTWGSPRMTKRYLI